MKDKSESETGSPVLRFVFWVAMHIIFFPWVLILWVVYLFFLFIMDICRMNKRATITKKARAKKKISQRKPMVLV